MGLQHIKAINKSKKASLHSIVDINKEALFLSKKFNIPVFKNCKELLNKNERIYRIVRRSSNVDEAQLSEIGRLSRDLSTPTLNNNDNYENERSLSSTPFAQEQILSPNTNPTSDPNANPDYSSDYKLDLRECD